MHPMRFTEVVWVRARKERAAIVLPESGDERVLRGAVEAVEKSVEGRVLLLGNHDSVLKRLPEYCIENGNMEIVDLVKLEHLE